MLPALSVVIPSHNRPDLLGACLASVRRHAPAGTEVVVVDDASPGGAVAEVVRRFQASEAGSPLPLSRGKGVGGGARTAGIPAGRNAGGTFLPPSPPLRGRGAGGEGVILPETPPPRPRPPAPEAGERGEGTTCVVRVLRLERQGGFAAAANAGVRAARHPIVETLNDDTEVTAGWAEAALDRFADDAVAAVAPLVLRRTAGGLRIDSAGDRYFVGGVAGKRGHGQPLCPEYGRAGPVFGASASSAFYRRDAFLAAGGFPESFGAYFEDVDLSFRLHRAGHRIVYEPASRVWHHVSASYGPPRRRLLEQQSRNEELVFWRNLPAAALVRALPLHGAVLAAKAWRRWREGNLLPFVRGRLRALAGLCEVWRHRRRLRPAETADVAAWGVEGRFWGGG